MSCLSTARHFKVWDANKTKKKVVKACGLQELISKGKEKLGLNTDHPIIVQLEDGTEIDDDESLEAFADQIMILSIEEDSPPPTTTTTTSPSSATLPLDPPAPYSVNTSEDLPKVKKSPDVGPTLPPVPKPPPAAKHKSRKDAATNTDPCDEDDGGGTNWGTIAKVGLGIGVGALGAVALAPVAVAAAGFGAGGIASGSLAASMMSASAAASGGGVAAGSAVAVLQSIGAAGLGATGTAVVGGAGATIGGAAAAAASQMGNSSQNEAQGEDQNEDDVLHEGQRTSRATQTDNNSS